MRIVDVHEVKAQLSMLLAIVEAGEEIVIARGGVPIARLIKAEAASSERRVPGEDRECIRYVDDLDAPLPDEIADEFER